MVSTNDNSVCLSLSFSLSHTLFSFFQMEPRMIFACGFSCPEPILQPCLNGRQNGTGPLLFFFLLLLNFFSIPKLFNYLQAFLQLLFLQVLLSIFCPSSEALTQLNNINVLNGFPFFLYCLCFIYPCSCYVLLFCLLSFKFCSSVFSFFFSSFFLCPRKKEKRTEKNEWTHSCDE